VAGLLISAYLAGLGPRSGQGMLVAAWYAGLTVLALALVPRASASRWSTGADRPSRYSRSSDYR